MSRPEPTGPTITNIRTATVRVQLREPIFYGQWVMRHREFLIVRIDADDGSIGVAYCLTRDGPLAQIIARTITPHYIGAPALDPERQFYNALYANHAVHAAGIGMRALSIVDVAAWDLAARIGRRPVGELVGDGPLTRLPATAIVGYPPSMTADAVASQISELHSAGWRRFKLPIAPDLPSTVARLRAAREVAPDAWIGFDANMVFRTAAEVAHFEEQVVDLRLGWIEDLVPPGDAALVARCRAAVRTPVAMGDEQGGSYHPQALLSAGAIDILRIDVTTNGGLTRLRHVVDQARAHGVAVAPHMYPHLHSRVLPAIGITEAPIEWGIPGTGVHPLDDCLEQPTIEDGYMRPLDADPGFGRLINTSWLEQHDVTDLDGLLVDL